VYPDLVRHDLIQLIHALLVVGILGIIIAAWTFLLVLCAGKGSHDDA
jgi:hypothetical protein